MLSKRNIQFLLRFQKAFSRVNFSSASAHSSNGEGEDHGHDHGFDSIVLDPKKKYVLDQDTKYIGFRGPQNATQLQVEVHNPWRNVFYRSIIHSNQLFNSYPDVPLHEEEERTHDEVYGYQLADDPFATTGSGAFACSAIFVILVMFMCVSCQMYIYNRGTFAERLYHTRETADLLEFQILKVREIEKKLRDKLGSLNEELEK